jgi:hypothetical protein
MEVRDDKAIGVRSVEGLAVLTANMEEVAGEATEAEEVEGWFSDL